VRGLLSWKERHTCFVAGTTVFSQVKWVSRRLTTRELADACDMPADKFKQGSDFWQLKLANQKVPGKILSQAIGSLVWEAEGTLHREQSLESWCTPTPEYANEDRCDNPTACGSWAGTATRGSRRDLSMRAWRRRERESDCALLQAPNLK
jgi:hypothetical protein